MGPSWSRRQLLGAAGLGALGVAGLVRAPAARAAETGDAWARAAAIEARVSPPRFPSRRFPVTDWGAVGDGSTDCTDAFRRAIAACNAAGGGHVDVPAGVFLTGAVHLLSGVDLHLASGSTIRFVQDPSAYLPVVYTRWQGIELMNYSPFVYAYGQHDIAVTGEGTLDGAADWTHWWDWNANADWSALQDMADAGTPMSQRVFGAGHYLRPSFVQPYRCRNVLIDGITVVNSPMWEIHPVLSSNVTVRNVVVDTHGPNNDGCDPESCRDVVITDSVFDVGDDCIALKSGRQADGRRVNVPCENVVIRRCDLRNKYGAITVGSEMTGGVRDVFVSDCRMGGDQLHYGLYVKTNALMGGFVESVYLRNIVNSALNHEFVSVSMLHSSTATGPYPPVVRDIEVRNVYSKLSRNAYSIVGLPDDPVRDVRLVNCVFDGVTGPSTVEDVDGLELRNVTVNDRPVSS